MRRVESVEFDDFEWDETKARHVFSSREIDFKQAAEALLRPHLEIRSDKFGESRILAICCIETKIASVIYTVRDGRCRIVTARAARRDERQRYRDIFGD